MRKLWACMIACVIVSVTMAATAQQMRFSGVASVIDGDTIEIHNRRIRLSGFDAPERGKYCGRQNVYQRASLALSDFTAQRVVTCEQSGLDDHGRVVAVCRVGEMDLGQYMVSLGWARDWPRYSNGAYAEAELAARRDRLGVWGMECPDDVWSGRDYAALPDASPPNAPERAARPPFNETAYVSAAALNVRQAPEASSMALGRLTQGARVSIIERQGSWARISFNIGDAWVHADYLSATPPIQRAVADGGGSDVRRLIVQESISRYSGSCPCPYNVDRGGRRCGARSAYSRPGGASPICYPSDVTDAHLQAFQARRQRSN